MRLLVTALLLALGLAVPMSAQTWTKSAWRAYDFAAEFPAEVTLDTSSMDDRPSATVGASMPTGYFAVTVAAMPEFTAEILADSTAREMILDSSQQQTIAEGGTILRSQRSIALGGRVGREFIATFKDEEAEVHTRIFLEEQRIIILIAVVANGSLTNLATRFLESFEFL